MRALIEPAHPVLSVAEQCGLLDLPRSTFYYQPAVETAENLELMRLLDEQYLRTPFWGVRNMTLYLRELGYAVNPKRVRRLLRKMGIEAVYPRPRTTHPEDGHQVYPYLLRDLPITRPNHVWASDITYIPMKTGFMYLVAVMDWYSRYVLSWAISNTMDVSFCLEALDQAFEHGRPEIFNTDQGSQFTSALFTGRLKQSRVSISMDGRGRVIDNVFIERLWRTVKYENVYLRSYEDGWALEAGLAEYFLFYNQDRFHQGLENRRPAEAYHGIG